MFYLFTLLWHKKLSLYISKDFNACKERKKAEVMQRDRVRKKESERERERERLTELLSNGVSERERKREIERMTEQDIEIVVE